VAGNPWTRWARGLNECRTAKAQLDTPSVVCVGVRLLDSGTVSESRPKKDGLSSKEKAKIGQETRQLCLA
jgi:hypothetical protein